MGAPQYVPQTPLALMIERLTGHDCHPKQRGGAWLARCPSHADSTPSLTVSQGKDGRVVVHCFAGCTTEAIVGALGMGMQDLFPAKDRSAKRLDTYDPNVNPVLVRSYDYTDADGKLLYQACRYRTVEGKKTFRQRRPHPTKPGEWVWNLEGVTRTLYRLPDVIEAVAMGRPVYIAEGEKDADTLAGIGYCATTSVGGAGKWHESYAEVVKGADVVIFADNDDPGKSHAEQVAASCANAGCTVKLVLLPGLPEKGDVTDWLEAGHDYDELADVIGKTRHWSPDPSTRTRWRLDELLDDDTVMRPPPPVVPRLAWESRSTLLASAPKAGKSTLTGYIAAQVSRGGHFLGDHCASARPGVVLVVGLEEYIGDAARRLRHFGADATRVYLVDTLPSDPLERPSALRAHVEAVKPVLVIVDTLIAYGGGGITDLNAAAQVGPVVQEITDLAHECGPAVILVHHAKKADGKYRDSSAIGGAVDVIAEMFLPDPDSDPTLRAMRVVGRVPSGDFRMRYDGRDFLLDQLTTPDGLTVGGLSLEDKIIAAVRTRPGCPAGTVVQVVHGNNADVRNAIQRLVVTGRLRDDGDDKGRKLFVPHA